MKILVFEYFTASGINNPDTISEAKAILESMLSDLEEIDYYDNNSDLKHVNCDYLLSTNNKLLKFESDYKNSNPIFIKEDLESWLKKNVARYDICIFVAAETENILYNLSKIIEDEKVKTLGSSSEAIDICTNKFKTFNSVKKVVKQPKTFKINIDNKGKWKTFIKNKLNQYKSHENNLNQKDLNGVKKKEFGSLNENFNKKWIIKPINGVDCLNTIVIKDIKDLNQIENNFDTDNEILLQEYIEGPVHSVSLIKTNEKTIPISLNKQFIELEGNNILYSGGCLPVEHPLKEEAFDLSKKAVESIDGLYGFIGVDLILNEHVYFLEINARLTTPYVGLNKVINFNILKTLIEDISVNKTNLNLNKSKQNQILTNIEFKNKIKFKKNKENLEISFYKN